MKTIFFVLTLALTSPLATAAFANPEAELAEEAAADSDGSWSESVCTESQVRRGCKETSAWFAVTPICVCPKQPVPQPTVSPRHT